MNQNGLSLGTMKFFACFKSVCFMLMIYWYRNFSSLNYLLWLERQGHGFEYVSSFFSTHNSHLLHQPPVERAAGLFIASVALVFFRGEASLSTPSKFCSVHKTCVADISSLLSHQMAGVFSTVKLSWNWDLEFLVKNSYPFVLCMLIVLRI